MGRVVYSSTPFTPFYPPCSVPSTSFIPGLVDQHLQTQQPNSVLPVVLIRNFVNPSDYLLFTAVPASSPSTMPYVPSSSLPVARSGAKATNKHPPVITVLGQLLKFSSHVAISPHVCLKVSAPRVSWPAPLLFALRVPGEGLPCDVI